MELNVEQIALKHEYYRGGIKKLTATNLMISFFIMALKGINTYSHWAQNLSCLIRTTVSKVCVWKRMSIIQVEYLRAILEESFKVNLQAQYLSSYKLKSLFSPFSKIYLQDSTVISLPDVLQKYYKGSVSTGKQKSSIRIQAVYSLFEGFELFKTSSFTDNDQKASKDILEITRKGDLVIRDLGYHVLKVFRGIALKKAFFLSRYHQGAKAYDVDTQHEVNLIKLFSKNKSGIVDINVLMGKKEQLPCRLVAVKIPTHVSAERKRKAKNDRDKRLNHSNEYYKLLEWSIYITNIDSDMWGWKEILQAYKTRWYIEIVFKGWKSHFNISRLIPEGPKKNKKKIADLKRYKTRVESVIYYMLIFIMIFHVHFYHYWVFKILQKYNKYISLLKLNQYVSSNVKRILESENINEFEEDLEYYACYEKRKKRTNQLEMALNQGYIN